MEESLGGEAENLLSRRASQPGRPPTRNLGKEKAEDEKFGGKKKKKKGKAVPPLILELPGG